MMRFTDTDTNLRKARETAYKSLQNGRLRNPSIGGEHFPPRNLVDTLTQEMIPAKFDDATEQAISDLEQNQETPLREYDAAREKRETDEMDSAQRKWEISQRLQDILNALTILADPQKASLDAETVEKIMPVLREAPGFIVGTIMSDTSQHVVETRKNWMQDAEKITRQINAALYPKLDDPNSAEFTMDDHKNTQELLHYMHERASVLDLAAGNLLTLVNKVNDAYMGKGPAKKL